MNLIKAYFTFGMGQERAGLDALAEGLRAGRQAGLVVALFLWRSPAFVMLCAKALEHGIEVEYVRGLITTLRLFPDNPPVELEHWPWPVRVYTLGRFAILRGDTEVVFSHKTQRKPLALLKAIIALGGRDVAVAQLGDILWPDADGDLAHKSLESAIHRLRNILGSPETVIRRDTLVSLNARYCWVDAMTFDTLLDEAEGLRAGDMHAQARQRTEQGLRLYRGAFLGNEGAEEPWLMTAAERMRNKFLRHVGWLARQWETDGQWDKAAACYEHCLDIDDCIEEAYQRLMLCYQRLGRRGEAMAVYRRCERTLATLLGVAPSPALKHAYNDLLKTEKP